MPLSDHEQHILQEIEKQFYERDPEARGVALRSIRDELVRNFRRGVALFVVGFVVLGVFFLRPALYIGVAAFLMMLGGATYAYHNARKMALEDGSSSTIGVSGLLSSFESRLKDLRRRKES